MKSTGTHCTNPERWKVIPGSDASDLEILDYNKHTEECPYHANLEKADQAAFDLAAEIAHAFSADEQGTLTAEEKLKLMNSLKEVEAIRETGRYVKTIIVRVPEGEDRIALPLKRNVKLSARRTAAIQIWKPADGDQPEVLLGVYLLRDLGRHRMKSSMRLSDNQSVIFDIRRRWKKHCSVSVTLTDGPIVPASVSQWRLKTGNLSWAFPLLAIVGVLAIGIIIYIAYRFTSPETGPVAQVNQNVSGDREAIKHPPINNQNASVATANRETPSANRKQSPPPPGREARSNRHQSNSNDGGTRASHRAEAVLLAKVKMISLDLDDYRDEASRNDLADIIAQEAGRYGLQLGGSTDLAARLRVVQSSSQSLTFQLIIDDNSLWSWVELMPDRSGGSLQTAVERALSELNKRITKARSGSR